MEINLNFFFQVELERLNKASDEINKLELELDVSYSFLLQFLFGSPGFV